MKTFTLYKRPDGADLWYFRFSLAGSRIQRCLGTADRKEAQAKARRLYEQTRAALLQGSQQQLDLLRMRRPPSATLAQVFAAYQTSPVRAGARARHLNELALRKIIRDSGLPGDPAALRVTEINDTLARTWFAAAARKSLAAGDQLAQQTIHTTANSWFNQANSLFSALALDWYKQHACYSPTFETFSKAGRMLRFKRHGRKLFHTAPDTVIAATLAAWEKLEDRDMFLAIGHELAFGLRRQEMAQARWSWWKTDPGYPVLDGEAWVKKGTGHLRVRALDPFYTILKQRIARENWRGEPDQLIIPGQKTYRTDDLYRQIGRWMRALGWTTEKTNHALRAYAGSQVAMRYDIYTAQYWLRHESVKTTEEHYAQYVKDYRPENLDTLSARWARIEDPAPPSATPDPAIPIRTRSPQPVQPGAWN